MENVENTLMEEAAKVYDIRHRCFHFAKDVIGFIKECQYQRIYFSIFDQLLRSATSIGANVVEGSSGSTKKDFINFFCIALKSANETKYWLCLIRDTIEVDRDKLSKLLQEADEISRIIAAIILSAK
jgi:four helix bundle protein